MNMSNYKKKKEEEAKKKTFYVSATYTRIVTFSHTNKNGKVSKHEKAHEGQPFSTVVKAKNEMKAKQMAADELNENMGYEKDDYEGATVSYEDIEFLPIQSGTPQNTANMPMRSANKHEYDFIPENTKHMKNEGFCVIDTFLAEYADLPRNKHKNITREWITSRCQFKKIIHILMMIKKLNM
jgi:hypothetical protein